MLKSLPMSPKPSAIGARAYRGGPFGTPTMCSHSKGASDGKIPAYKSGGPAKTKK